jgi:lysozyme family protein
MMFDICFPMVIKHEGGFVEHPSDPGGMTNLGITKATWEDWVKREVTEEEMRNLTVKDVKPLYKARYWDAVRADDLPRGVDYAVFDFAVNSGVTRASRMLQECVGATKDGIIGPKTIEATKRHQRSKLVQEICDKRLEFLQGLPHFPTFAKGWTRRVLEVAKAARDMSE